MKPQGTRSVFRGEEISRITVGTAHLWDLVGAASRHELGIQSHGLGLDTSLSSMRPWIAIFA